MPRVLGWAIIAGFFTGTVYVWSLTEAAVRWVVLFGGLALIAVTFLWLFRPRRLGNR